MMGRTEYSFLGELPSQPLSFMYRTKSSMLGPLTCLQEGIDGPLRSIVQKITSVRVCMCQGWTLVEFKRTAFLVYTSSPHTQSD